MMNAQRGCGKKRKQADSGDAERNLYGSFVHAANAVSQLYTAGLQASKKAEEQGARRALERVAQFVVKEYGNAPSVPTAVLMEVLRQELQAAQGSAAAIQLPFPVPLLPTGGDSQASDAHSDDEHLMSAGEPSPGAGFRRTPSGHTISPPKGVRPAPGQLPTLFQQQQQQQQQQMQAAAAQQQQQQQAHAAAQQAAMHQQLLAQMQQQQQQPGGFMPGGFPGQFQ